MTDINAKFRFPTSTYYQQAESFKNKLDNFSDEMDNEFFQIVQSGISSLNHQDQYLIERSFMQGQQKLRSLESEYIWKWNRMKNENSNNPMNPLVACDAKYQKIFNELQNGKINKKVEEGNLNFDRKVVASLMDNGFLEKEMVEMMEEVVGHDWYSRLKQASSLGDFFNDFSKKFVKFTEKHPEEAAALISKMEKSKHLKKMLELSGDPDFIKKLKNNPQLKNIKRFKQALSSAGNLINGKWLKEGMAWIEIGADKLGDKKVSKWAGKALKGPWGTGIKTGVNGYYNVKNEEVLEDFQEGRVHRAGGKVITGTVIDTLKGVDAIDGLITGAIVGGGIGVSAGGIGAVPGAIVGGAIGTVVGGSNQLVQFIWPSAYSDLKTATFKGIDWTADKGIKAWENTKEFGKNTWSQTKDVGKSIGIGLKAGLNRVKSTVNKKVSNVVTAGQAIGKGVKETVRTIEKTTKTVKQVKDTVDSILNPKRIPIPILGGK